MTNPTKTDASASVATPAKPDAEPDVEVKLITKQYVVTAAKVNWLTEPLSEDPKVPARYRRYKTGDTITADPADPQIQRYLRLDAVKLAPVQTA